MAAPAADNPDGAGTDAWNMRDCSFILAGVRYRSPLLGIQAGETPCCPARRPCLDMGKAHCVA